MSEILLKRTANAASCRLGREVALLDKRDGVYYRLNEVGGVIWDELSQPRSIQQLADAVQARFDSTAEATLEDVKTFLEELQKRDLVKCESC